MLAHRTQSQISEIRKSRRYKNLKEKLSYEAYTGGESPPSPAVLLTPNSRLPLTLPIVDSNSLFTVADTPRTARRPAALLRDPDGASNLQFPSCSTGVDEVSIIESSEPIDTDSPTKVLPFADASFSMQSSQDGLASLSAQCSTPVIRAPGTMPSAMSPSSVTSSDLYGHEQSNHADVSPSGISLGHSSSPILAQLGLPLFVNLPVESTSSSPSNISVVPHDEHATSVIVSSDVGVSTSSQMLPDSSHLYPSYSSSLPGAGDPALCERTPFQLLQVGPAAAGTVDHSSPPIDDKNDNTELSNSTKLTVFNFMVNLPSVRNLPIFNEFDDILINFANNYTSIDFINHISLLPVGKL